MDDIEALKRKLTDLKSQHRDLDKTIEELSQDRSVDQLRLQRMKKRKLELKDQITVIEDRLLPDIIA